MSEKEGMRRHGVPLHLVIILMFLVGTVFSGIVLIATFKVTDQYANANSATQEFLACQNAVYTVRDAIHDLNEYARDFAVSGNAEQVIQYFNEIQVKRSVDSAVEEMESYLVNDRTLKQLETAIQLSTRMSEIQQYAMRLSVEAYEYDINRYPVLLKNVELTEEDLALSREEQRNRALDLLFSKDYVLLRGQVDVRINLCKDTLVESMTSRQQESSEAMHRQLRTQRLLVIGLSAVLLLVLLFVLLLVVQPIRRLVRGINNMEQVGVRGSSEMMFLVETYNQMTSQMQDANAKLDYKATHDALTGLYNRSAYDALWGHGRDENIALLIVDVDYFKEVNDTYGHDVGDKVLIRVANILTDSFREADKVCRIGGDEFSVIMVGVTSAVTGVIRRKIDGAAKLLAQPEGNVPGVTISVGVAFSDQLKEDEDLFKNADRALYRVKENGRNGCGFYSESNGAQGSTVN